MGIFDNTPKEAPQIHVNKPKGRVLCLVFQQVAGVDLEAGHRKISFKQDHFVLDKDKYTIDPTAAKWVKSRLGSYRAVLEYDKGNSMPRRPTKSDLKTDAAIMNKVTSKGVLPNLLPSVNTMLEILCIILAVSTMIFAGLAFYLLADDNASKNLKAAFNPPTNSTASSHNLTPPPNTNPNARQMP